MILSAGSFEFRFPRPALVMGIVNVTPDSFSDGGRFSDQEAAIVHGMKLAEEGADMIDVGGESTRPNAQPVSEDEELRRVLPVVQALARQLPIPISIDTVKPAVARAAMKAGAAIINDVAANREDDAMWKVAAGTGAGYVVMHMKGTPQTMQRSPEYADVAGEIDAFFADRLNRLAAAGVRAEQTVLDVGIGFGKTLEHNLELLGRLAGFTKWRRPLLLGVSRKSFIGQLTGAAVTERLPGSLACACLAAGDGVGIIRTHDVAATRQALTVAGAVLRHRTHVLGSDTE